MRKRIVVVIGLSMLLLTSCNVFGGNTPPQATPVVKAPPNQQVFTYPLTGISDITTFDPALAFDAQSITAIQMVFTGLVQLNDQQQVVGGLAQTWSVSPDGLDWTFHLKKNLKFSNGALLTSADVAYSIDRALQPATKSTVAPIYLNLVRDSDKLLAGSISTLINDTLLTPNDSTIIIETKTRAPYFLAMLTHPCSYVVEKQLIQVYGANFTDHLVDGGGAGPFRVTKYTHGKEIDFVPNQFYYGPHPQLQKVIFPFYVQDAHAYNDYQAGTLDATGVPVSTFTNDKKRPDYHQVPQLWINYYTMNYLAKPFDNIQIRQAFALAIDKSAIASTVWHGTVLPTNHIVPQGMNGYNPALTGPDGTQSLRGNSALAKTLLMKGMQAEGWSSVAQMPPIKLTYAGGVSNFGQEVTTMIGMWQNVLGVTVTANPVDYNTLLADITAATNNPQGLQIWGLAWVGEYPDPQDWLTRQFDAGVPNNNMNYGQNYSNDAARQQNTQRLLEAADANFQPQPRLQAYQQAEQQLINDVAWLPMEQVTQVYLLKPYVIGMASNPQGQIPPDDWAKIFIAQH